MTSATDHNLTIKAMETIIRGMKTGKLRHILSVSRRPTQVVISHPFRHSGKRLDTDEVAWIQKRFGEGNWVEQHGIVRPKGSSKRFEDGAIQIPLRDGDTARPHMRDFIPRVEIWGVLHPHVCSEFEGWVAGGTPRWRCSRYGCKQRILKSKARELGLLP